METFKNDNRFTISFPRQVTTKKAHVTFTYLKSFLCDSDNHTISGLILATEIIAKLSSS